MTKSYSQQEIESWPFCASRKIWSGLLNVSTKWLFRAEKENQLVVAKKADGQETLYTKAEILNCLRQKYPTKE
jgi:hypothetical protein